jgi:inorganic pyrophosphatase
MLTDFLSIPIGKEAPKIVTAVVEIAKDTSAKYEYDSTYNIFRLDRCLMSSMSYPASYGFVPSTISDDGDALDILIYDSTPIMTGTVVDCVVVGVLDMTDSGKKDYKLLGIPKYHPCGYTKLEEIEPIFLRIATNFFKHYKDLEGKKVAIGEWMGAEAAYEIIKQSNINYKNEKGI